MAKQYYIKKDPAVSGPDVEWTAINGKEFYQLITSPAGKGRYFIDMDEYMIESTEAEYKDWRKEKDHTDYLHEQEARVQMLPLYDGEVGGPGGLISAISYILTNERYTGDSLWQKTYATDTLPTRQVRNHGEREQYFAEATHAPIIEKEIFQAVQELKKERVEKYGARTQRQGSPLQQKIFCGECGSRFRKKICRGVAYWACLGHDKDRQSCLVQQIPETEIQAAFLRLYHKLRLHGEPVLKQMISNLQSVQERRMLWSLEIVELNKAISGLFGVSINTLLGYRTDLACQSCGMPIVPEQMGREPDGTPNERYCKWCWDNGDFFFNCTMEQMVDQCLPHMPFGTPEENRKFLTGPLPTLDRWKKKEA